MATRKTDKQRDSKPASPVLYRDAGQKAQLEARNSLLQFDRILALVDATTPIDFRLRPSAIQDFQRIAVQDIYSCAGNYRNGPVSIANTTHQPPPWQEIPSLVEDLCEHVNGNTGQSAIHLSAYVMWRVNWIHPFFGGNGRTSRAASYLVLCSKLGYRMPGTLTIPAQIADDRQPYYAALDAADAAWESGRLDVSVMENLLSAALAKQLLSVHNAALGKKP